MAKKKSSTSSAAPKKKKAATRKAAPKKKASAETATKTLTPKATKARSAAPKKTAVKKASAVKLTDKQRELLAKVHGAGETGYTPSQKAEVRSLDALKEKKLLKTGKKDKATGTTPYKSTRAGEKALAPSA